MNCPCETARKELRAYKQMRDLSSFFSKVKQCRKEGRESFTGEPSPCEKGRGKEENANVFIVYLTGFYKGFVLYFGYKIC